MWNYCHYINITAYPDSTVEEATSLVDYGANNLGNGIDTRE